MHRLLSQVMVDAVDLFFLEILKQLVVKLLCCVQIVAEGFLNDDAFKALCFIVQSPYWPALRG